MEWLGKQPPAVDVKTKDGIVRGSWIRDREFQEDVAIFNGIPYAEPPVGKLRWRPPQPVKPWDGVKLTRRYSPEAPQLGMEFMGFLRFAVQKHAFGAVQSKAYIHGARLLRTRLAAAQSEDCLYLNVRTTSRLVLRRGLREFKREGDENRPPDSIDHIDSPDAVDATKGMEEEEVELLPVIVYFHGGDHHDGAGGSRPFYVANALPVKGRVVLVTFNYRLGVLGHFTHPELAKEAEEDGRPAVSGNYSVLDQAEDEAYLDQRTTWRVREVVVNGGNIFSRIPNDLKRELAAPFTSNFVHIPHVSSVAVLHWVRRNISAFGGDPDNITIMGSSAGGESVLYMMTSPLARGLFHKAISQSPACTSNSLLHLRAPFACFRPSEDNGIDFAFRLVGVGPDQLTRLRNLPLRRIMNAYYQDGTRRPEPRQLFYPVVDGHVIPRPPMESFARGEQAAVPFVIGNNMDEGSLCFPVTFSRTRIRDSLYPSPVREAGQKAYGPEAAATLADLYDPEWRETGEVAGDGSRADCDFFTDRVFGHKVHWLATHHRRLLGQPTYVYRFAAFPPREGQTVGAFHGAEVPFAFGARPWFFGGPEDKRLASAMPDYWTAFARDGDPNRTIRPQVYWPMFNGEPGKGRMIVLGHSIEARVIDRLDRYAIIESHVRKVLSDLEDMRKWEARRTVQEREMAARRVANEDHEAVVMVEMGGTESNSVVSEVLAS